MDYKIERVETGWKLTIYAKVNKVCTSKVFKKRIEAIRAVSMLQLHLAVEDKILAA